MFGEALALTSDDGGSSGRGSAYHPGLATAINTAEYFLFATDTATRVGGLVVVNNNSGRRGFENSPVVGMTGMSAVFLSSKPP